MTHHDETIRQSERTWTQRWITDPVVAVVAMVLWGILKLLPTRIASPVGGFLGGVVGHLAWRRNHIGMVNLRIAFPDKTEDERRQILRRMWRHWGRFYAEMPHAHNLFKHAEIRGLDNLKQAAAAGKGGFVCSAHLGNWELAVAQPLFDHFYLNPVYRPANNPWLDKLMFQRRQGVLIPKGQTGAKKILEVLKNKGFIVMLCDQKLREGIAVPFFGKPAMTAPAIAVLALKYKLPILMAKVIRQPDGHFVIDVSKPLILSKNPDFNTAVAETMTTINHIYEKWITAHPEQWLWIHRRYDKSEY